MAKKTFYCLRCQQRFPMDHERGVTVERTCPKCRSNSVRLETALSAKTRESTKTP